jgi:hypothetical protein
MGALRGARAARWLLAAGLLIGWLEVFVEVLGAPPADHPLAALVAPIPLALMTIVVVAALIAFVAGRAELVAGILVLVAIAFVASLESGTHHGKLVPAIALAAYLPATALTGDARRGHEAACGAIGAAYVLAALAKLSADGLGWGQSGSLALLVAERSFEGPTFVRALRSAIAARPALTGILAAGSLAVELGGIAFLFPRARRVWAVAVIVMHAGIALLMGYVYLPWALVVGGLAWSSLASERQIT